MRLLLVAGFVAVAATALAQEAPERRNRFDVRPQPVFGQPVSLDRSGQQATAVTPVPEGECSGCPKRHPWIATAEVLGINVLYNVTNLIIKPEEEKIYFKTYPETWWSNMTYGFEWDDNTFQVNQFGHPYQGNNYFTAGRANGLSFWESAPLAALGSLTWEYMGERHRPSLNDLVMTTVGGISLGEMFHRTAWLIRDPQKTGKGRFWSEFGAMVVDPVTGLNRLVTGDFTRVAEKPAHLVPEVLSAAVDAGVLWRGEDTAIKQASGEAFVQLNMAYGTPTVGDSRLPFDAFRVDMRFGGGGPISEAIVRGRLYGRQISAGPEGPAASGANFGINLTYDYRNNDAYQFGGQGVAGVLSHRRPLGSTMALHSAVSATVLLLGAMDSLYVAGEERQYDFGPGFAYGLGVQLLRKELPLLRATYGGLWLHTVDGAQVDHVTNSVRVDAFVPIKGPFALGATGEFIQRKSYYDNLDDVQQRFPQFRVYLSWLN